MWVVYFTTAVLTSLLMAHVAGPLPLWRVVALMGLGWLGLTATALCLSELRRAWRLRRWRE